MEKETIALLTKLVEMLNERSTDTTGETFEQSAARFNEQAAFAAAESQKAFVQQNAAQFAQLLQMQKMKKDH